MSEKGFLASIQTEGADSRVWVRLTSVKTSKDKHKDRKKLEKARASYVAYYPGEPYLYTITHMDDIIVSALVSGLGCRGSKKLELSGKSVASLRSLRLGRDARDDEMKSGTETNHTNRFSVFNKNLEAAPEHGNYPKLEQCKQCKYFLRVIYPSFCIIFIVLFWIIGLFNYYK